MATFTAIPQLVVDFSYFTPAGKKEVLTIREGDILKDVIYKDVDGVIRSKTGKVTAIMTTETKSTTNYGSCACHLRSSFAAHVIVDGFVLDCSDVYESDTNMIFVKDLESIGAIAEGKKEVDLANLPEGGLAAIIAELQPGQELKLGVGEIKEALVIPAGVTIRGANAGISAAKGYRAQGGVIEGETVISAPITAATGNIILDGVTLTGKAVLTPGHDAELVVSNTRFVDFVGDGTNTSRGKNDAIIKGVNATDDVKLVVMNSYFGEATGIYNLAELGCNLQSGSSIRNCYFAANACRNNAIAIYEVADEASIAIVDNTFEKSANAVRIGTKQAAECTINITNNTYMETDSNEAYAGLVLIQPYGKVTTSMGAVTININGTKNMTEQEQLWYYYAGNGDAKLEGEDLPKVYVDGVKQEVINIA